MKPRNLCWWGMGVALTCLPFAGSFFQEAAFSVEQPKTAAVASASENHPTNAPPKESASPVEGQPSDVDISDAPVTADSAEKPAPTNIRTNGPIGEIIRLANAGLDESVMLAFVTNSTSVFALNADEIVYLRDIGVPGSVITTILQHDEQTRATLTEAAQNAAAAAPPQEPQYAPAPADEPPPAPQVAQAPVPEGYSSAVDESAAPDTDAYTSFYQPLAPYGTWVNVAGYGMCWQPTIAVVNSGWQPYCDGGHWVYSDCGWYWLSDYTWGWAPFHYGRWFQHRRLGWCWYPDRYWGPSWVSWRYNDAYCGWAPLPPCAVFRPGIGLTYWGRHVAFNFSFGLGADCFSFVAWNNFHGRHLHSHTLPLGHRENIFRATTVSSRITGDGHRAFNHGLSAARVAAATRTEIHKVALHEVSAPRRSGMREGLASNGRSLTFYRPSLDTPGRGARGGRRETGTGNALQTPNRPSSQTGTPNSPYRTWSRPRTLDPGPRPDARKPGGRISFPSRQSQGSDGLALNLDPSSRNGRPSEQREPSVQRSGAEPSKSRSPWLNSGGNNWAAQQNSAQERYRRFWNSTQSGDAGQLPARPDWAGRPNGTEQTPRTEVRRTLPRPGYSTPTAPAQVPRFAWPSGGLQSRSEPSGAARGLQSPGFQSRGQAPSFNWRAPAAVPTPSAPAALPVPRSQAGTQFSRPSRGGR